jgi:hypothetical protein
MAFNSGALVQVVEQAPSEIHLINWRCLALSRLIARRRQPDGSYKVVTVNPGEIVQVYDHYMRALRMEAGVDEMIQIAGRPPEMPPEFWLSVLERGFNVESKKTDAQRDKQRPWDWKDGNTAPDNPWTRLKGHGKSRWIDPRKN